MADSVQQRSGSARPQLRLDELLSELQTHIQRVRDTRDRVHTLLDAVMAIGGDLDLDAVLHQIVQSAVTLVDAEYGALGVLGDEDTIAQFITVGMDEPTIAGIGHYPEGHGILGLLIREPEPLRLDDLNRHPDAVGFPADHPPMDSFLGAPVRVRGRAFGNLYLTNKRGPDGFDADDEAVLQTLATAAGVAIDNARLYDDARRREQWLAASSELSRSLLSGTDPGEVLQAVTATVREMTGADLVTLAVPVPGADTLVIEAAAGADADRARGLVLPATATLAGKVFSSGEPITTADWSSDARAGHDTAAHLRLGPAFMVPLGSTEHVRGVLQIAARPGRPAFADATIDMIAGFAGHAALALEIADRRRDAEQLLVMSDRDRIARDLHDLVIQRLFADGLTLQAALARATGRPDITERVERVVDGLDSTIKVIRSTIFALQERGRGHGVGLRARLLTETDQAAEALGFTPALRMTGLLDTAVPHEQAEHLVAVLREALANTVRHAGATAVDISAEATDSAVRLHVSDNGCGIDPAASRRSGLANLHSRARELGGTLTFAPNDPSGTVLEFEAPLPAL
ncbi:GAF domain-containing protein [Streptomyces europaeiscabiei]|uniref:sensor histidine kinase n=1 Tax=Streptomyces europaeiscabiei TaxID=146819 RepID=UPI002E2D1AA9|nr:GAF domain-containing protein [Streptomyces europaeiscabiei]